MTKLSIEKVQSGSSLTQYIIIIALIAVVVTGTYFIMGQTIVNKLEAFYLSLQNSSNDSDISKPKDGKIIAGQLGGTPDNPVQKCLTGSCSIDYGNFILNGI